MITKEQMVNGLVSYIDNEIIPVLPTAGKWGIGALVIMGQKKYNILIDEIMKNPIIHAFGLVDDRGMIDNDSLFTALRASASKYGNLELSMPIIGSMSFSSGDVDKLEHYIGG